MSFLARYRDLRAKGWKRFAALDIALDDDWPVTDHIAYRIGRGEAVREIRRVIKARDVTMQVTRDELMEILDEVEGHSAP